MSKEYIERSAAIVALEDTDWYSINCKGEVVLGASDGDTALFKASDMFALLRYAPTADVAPVVHAYWEEYWDDNYLSWCHKCSNCGNFPLTKEETMHDEVLSEFCPHCGTKMDGGK